MLVDKFIIICKVKLLIIKITFKKKKVEIVPPIIWVTQE